MSAKTYDRQSGKFIARVAENLPEMSNDIMQGWIDNPKALQKFLEGLCPSTQIGEHIIDCDATPFIPDSLTIHSHKKGGQIRWNPENFKLWLHPKQENGGNIDGHKWLKWMEKKPVYNACMLDYWLAHPEIIPSECKGKWTYFPNTVYRGSLGFLFVRCLNWGGGRPVSDCAWLGFGWGVHAPAAGSAS